MSERAPDQWHVDELLDALESILMIAEEEHFSRSAEAKLLEIRTYARLAIKKLEDGV